MSNCIEKLPHSCGTRNGLQVFAREDGGVDGYCFSCATYVRHPYGDEVRITDLNLPPPKTEAEIQGELNDISSYQTLALSHRKLSEEALEEFGVKIGVSENDGKTPSVAYYPYYKDGKLSAYKAKTINIDNPKDKQIFIVGNIKGADFFGWNRALERGSRRIIITEGEDDAIALSRIIERFSKDEFRDYTSVISLPNGAGNASRDLNRIKDDLTKFFKEVYLCFDNDKPGKEAVKEAMLVVPYAKQVSLPNDCKDANEALIKGKAKAVWNAVFNAEVPKNTRIVFGEDLHEEAREPAKFGELTWPWPHMNKATRGIRYGETIYIGAGVKMGKGEIRNSIVSHFIKEHDTKVFVVSPEESNKKSYKLIAGKVTGNVFHDPDREFNFKEYDRAGEILKDRLALVNLYQHLGWETLKADIISAVSWGAKAVFIDPITNLTNGVDAGEANSKLQEIAQELAAMALNYNIVIFIFCHLKAPEGNIAREKRDKFYHDGKYIGLGNCPHEHGGDIYSSQFAGSRAMMRSCNMMIGLEGNKDDELPREVRNMRDLVILEDREFGETGRFGLFWNQNTTQFEERV
jgi:twinkle protein